jgi:hypothetical protein
MPNRIRGPIGRSLRHGPPSSGGGGLLYRQDLQYLGGFRLPPYQGAADQFSFGGHALGWNAANGSLFVTGPAQAVAEVSVPASPVNSAAVTDLPTATLLQDFRRTIPDLPTQLPDGGIAYVGGLLCSGGKLYGAASADYTGANSQATSHFVIDSLNLAASGIAGLYAINNGTPGARTLGGYMCDVPSNWRAALGRSALTGQGNLSVIATTSAGPAMIGFDPSAVGVDTAHTTPYCYYPQGHMLGPYYADAFDPCQMGTCAQFGMAFPEGSDSVLVFGKGPAQVVE